MPALLITTLVLSITGGMDLSTEAVTMISGPACRAQADRIESAGETTLGNGLQLLRLADCVEADGAGAIALVGTIVVIPSVANPQPRIGSFQMRFKSAETCRSAARSLAADRTVAGLEMGVTATCIEGAVP